MAFAVDENIFLNLFCNAVTKNLNGFSEIYQLVVFQLLLRLVKEKYMELLERSTVVIVVPLLSVMN